MSVGSVRSADEVCVCLCEECVCYEVCVMLYEFRADFMSCVGSVN